MTRRLGHLEVVLQNDWDQQHHHTVDHDHHLSTRILHVHLGTCLIFPLYHATVGGDHHCSPFHRLNPNAGRDPFYLRHDLGSELARGLHPYDTSIQRVVCVFDDLLRRAIAPSPHLGRHPANLWLFSVRPTFLRRVSRHRYHLEVFWKLMKTW